MLCVSMGHGFSISWIDSLTQAIKKFLSFPYNLHYFNGKFVLRKLAIHSIGKTKHFGKPEIYGIHAGALKIDIESHTVH